MSEAVRRIYEKREERRIEKAVHNLNWNRKFRAKMITNGEIFRRRNKDRVWPQ